MLLAYLKKHWIFSLLIGYEVVAVVLAALNIADVGIPCLFTLIFGVHCYGCGMTHASIDILQFHFHDAWEANPLSFIVLPLLTFAIVMDFLKFRKQYNQK